MKKKIEEMLQGYRDLTWELSSGSGKMREIRSEVAECILDLIPQWISVKDRLPEIPKGKFGVSVLSAQYDPVYAEISNGHGYSVSKIMFDNEGFKVLCVGWSKESDWMPPGDEVTHWMPLPEPPEAE